MMVIFLRRRGISLSRTTVLKYMRELKLRSVVIPKKPQYRKGRIHYDLYSLQSTEEIPDDYEELSFVCLRQDGSYEATTTLSNICRQLRNHIEGLENFHFHQLRHTYTSHLLSNGAAPKDVQELLGHSDVSTTMNVYAHATREAKRTSARLLDKVVGGN